MPPAVKALSSEQLAVTYSRGTIEYKLLNKALEEPTLRARRANAHRPSPGELFRIDAGRSFKDLDEPLRADMFKRKLEDVEGGYEAPSYYWDLNVKITAGERSNQRPVELEMWKTAANAIGYTEFRIRKNLYEGLLRLRSKYRDTEGGKVEKAKQLAMMARICNSASNVCVWLGEEYNGSNIAFSFIRDIMNYCNFDEMILGPGAKEGWKNLISIMKAPWFSRRWVIQEIALSRDATVHCGDQSLHWENFADAISLLIEKLELIRERFKDDVFDDVETTSACILAQRLCNVCRETLVSTLLGFQASFPRDTIYSILSLAKDFPRPQEEWQRVHTEQLELNFKIRKLEALRDRIDKEVKTQPVGPLLNYKFSARDLFIAFVTRSIYVSGSLDIVCRHWAPRLNHDEGGDMLPSWISSLSKSAFGVPGAAQGRQNGENFVAYLPHDGRRRYLASGPSRANMKMAIDPTLEFQDPRCLLGINLPKTRSARTDLATASYQLEASPNMESVFRDAAAGSGSRRLSVSRTASETRQAKLSILKANTANNRQRNYSSGARPHHRLSGILCVEGFILGEIANQSEVTRAVLFRGWWVAKLGWEKDVQSDNRVPDILWRLLVADRTEKGGKPPQWYKRACLHGLVDDKVSDNQGNIHPVTYSNRRISELTSRYFNRVETVVWNRRIFELKLDKDLHSDSAPRGKNNLGTEDTRRNIAESDEQDPIYGLAPQGSKISDIVCILLGCSVPVVLSKDHGHLYKIVGEAYVYGMMDGEAMDIMPQKVVKGNLEDDLRIFELT
ncbi:hypothetical protein F4859DRAFT_507861 [Xylaria cf. heliscus]|nr:hypothetical protein F4859DRAFT_507861 [Xylaria cf. heliscus]